MKPLIGITCGYDNEMERVLLTQFYSRGVLASGGVPLLLPPVSGEGIGERYCELLDGLILSGGGDVDPEYFGEEPISGSGEITPERDAFEIALVQKWLEGGKPLLAICRGMQVLNIAAGGDIYQDIKTQGKDLIKHIQEAPKWYASHKLYLEDGTLLSKIFPEKSIKVNSFHHQAVRRLAPGFNCAARSSDGLIEAIEFSSKVFVLGVQWHPECMWERDEKQLKLFQQLVRVSSSKEDFDSG